MAGKVWSAICDRCGFEYPSDQLKKEWTGLMVCEADFDHRHPQDFAKIPRPEKPLPWTRPEAPDSFVSVSYIATTEGVQETTNPSGTFDNGL